MILLLNWSFSCSKLSTIAVTKYSTVSLGLITFMLFCCSEGMATT